MNPKKYAPVVVDKDGTKELVKKNVAPVQELDEIPDLIFGLNHVSAVMEVEELLIPDDTPVKVVEEAVIIKN